MSGPADITGGLGGLPPAAPPGAKLRSDVAMVLNDKLERMISESIKLRTDVTAAEAQRARELGRRRQENLVMLGFLAVMGVMLMLLLAVAWQNNIVAKDARRTAVQLEDCISPQGRCYQDSQKRTADVIDTIRRGQLYIVECSRQFPIDRYPPGPAFDVPYEKCVADRLATRPPAPSAPPLPPLPQPSPR